ncbi:hypothetical protein RO3G_01418 [Rhizopus delemar RA 99-880]|uniref:Uncharacterized protein n=1 Tax=Rhizopus delemar (strain RA 99-880 / ATCC MYA-4621 / FGSC 9543 / NRRL 43880) TaxID=246409 RepID=I1BKI4_RHIO9|nr:hypothetical protein RO3G_01418 [Rhizopus delemar RA 99-880]|eukprot:EIE76714.1 hypothetical protein RO3G_01418 [Rhizopus delemar RA 99-880]
MKATTQVVARGVEGCNAEFDVGERFLKAMGKQIKYIGINTQSKSQYKADGIVSLYGVDNMEVLLLETSGHFKNDDQTKISFDHHKALYGTLAMLKCVSDTYKFGSMKTFQKIKIFFLQAANNELLLWSLRFEPDGPLCELWLERSLTIDHQFDKKEFLKETVINIQNLKDEHYSQLKSLRFVTNTRLNLLTTASMLPATSDHLGSHPRKPIYGIYEHCWKGSSQLKMSLKPKKLTMFQLNI